MAKTTKKRLTKAAGKKARNYRILALDGGGIRGLITAVWLEELEKRLGASLYKHFDLVAGTSTGSILACAIGLGVPAAKVRRLYVEWAEEIFPGLVDRLWDRGRRAFSDGISAPKYDGQGLERALRAQFGDVRFGELEVPTLVTAYNTLTRSAAVFKSERERYGQLPIWEITKASCSAPSYFPATVIEVDGALNPFVDGGVVANNPTACAIAEGLAIRGGGSSGLEDFVVVSVGTGQSTRPVSIEKAKGWGALEWAVPVVDVLMDGAADAVDYIAQQLLPSGRYFRFQVPLDEAYDDLDNASATNINALQSVANSYLRRRTVRSDFEELIKLL